LEEQSSRRAMLEVARADVVMGSLHGGGALVAKQLWKLHLLKGCDELLRTVSLVE
jgi:hypothetical protein